MIGESKQGCKEFRQSLQEISETQYFKHLPLCQDSYRVHIIEKKSNRGRLRAVESGQLLPATYGGRVAIPGHR